MVCNGGSHMLADPSDVDGCVFEIIEQYARNLPHPYYSLESKGSQSGNKSHFLLIFFF